MASRTALITGASSGIGLELAKILATNDHDLVVVARREERLQELAREIEDSTAAQVTVLATDLARSRAVSRLVRKLQDHGLDIDVLVNNAGVMDNGPFARSASKKISTLLSLNVVALTELTHALLPPMIERRWGRLLNVASLASFQPVPNLAAYAASKAFVLSLTESLSEELAGTGVTTSALCPGLTETEMVTAAEGIQVPQAFMMDAKSVARAGYRAMQSGKVVEIPGIANELTAHWTRLQPRWLVRMLSGFAARAANRPGS